MIALSLNIWTRTGSEKTQSSQTIRILLRSLQYLAEDSAQSLASSQNFTGIVVPIIRNLFVPAEGISINEQLSTFLRSLGWKNAQIRTLSATKAEIVLGNNRHLEQVESSKQGLTLLVKSIMKAIGYYLLNREVDALVRIDFTTGVIYNIELNAVEIQPSRGEPASLAARETTGFTSSPSSPSQPQTIKTEESSLIDPSQLFQPILHQKLPLSTLYVLLQDVMSEFANSWYNENPLEGKGTDDSEQNVLILTQFLVEKTLAAGRSTKTIGDQIGRFFAQSLQGTFGNSPDAILTPEIIESDTVTMIRDIKARSLCTLSPGDKCTEANRAICDFGMGIYEGVLSSLTGKKYEFTNYFAAGKRDIYCLMEFQITE
ncbi:MAG: hypothetical protein D6732_14000 [Methanobacteriota archaeon]|nr:MAG: hypothetical protein D6732_14000 [Euryarchaeota archaeon]